MSLHLTLVHFPVALLVVGAAFDLGGAATQSERLRRAAGVLLLLGSAAVVAAFLSGPGAVGPALGRLDPGDPRLEAHTQWAAGGLWAVVPAAVLRLLWRGRMQGPQAWATLAAGAVTAIVILRVALSGTAISHGS